MKKNDNCDLELLQYIYQNAKMGESSLKVIKEDVKDDKLRLDIEKQIKGYKDIASKAGGFILKSGDDIEATRSISKIMTYTGIKINMALNNKTEHIAEVLIEGSTMGVIDITKNIKRYEACAKNTVALAKSLLSFEQKNIEIFKKYL